MFCAGEASSTTGAPGSMPHMLCAAAGNVRTPRRPRRAARPGTARCWDMGPYYISALIHLLGPVRAVIGAASQLRDARVIG